jgi:Ca-activated chloride channel homolog
MNLPIKAPFMVFARRISAVVVSLLLIFWMASLQMPAGAQSSSADSGARRSGAAITDCSDSGILVAMAAAGQKELGRCPLKHTSVKASISGYVARVSVRQQFHNPFQEKIEAVYTFPLPAEAAVDEMTMKVGSRVIKGSIKKREEARQIYDQARARGNVAALLDQERPNIFTQSVANIEPGENIDIEINYVNLLAYEDGAFTFSFPTVVGPRFIPGTQSLGRTGTGTVPDTNMVPDASRITPTAAKPGQRAGHDLSIEMNINAGVPIRSLGSKLHEVLIERKGASTANIKLKDMDSIPNKDFVVSWTVTADLVQSGYLTHRRDKDGFFTLILIPPKRVAASSVQPKEMVFVIDCSGSQSGRPIQKAKETMAYILDHMNPRDTFQIITFNNNVEMFPDYPKVASATMKADAISFIQRLQARGGTWMAPAVEAACSLPNPDHRLRIMTFMTDGYVGNDFQIIGMIKKYRDKARWFSFGTGNSVNRFLIDNIAKEGGGEAEYVLLNTSAEEVGKKFYDRISSPVLSDLKIEFKGVETKEVFPKNLADLWAQRPLYFSGRYLQAGSGKVILSGYSGGKPYKQEMKLDFPDRQDANEVLPSIWARAKVERLMSEDWCAAQSGNLNPELKDEIIACALKYHIMSQYTSFVAVEEDRKTSGDRSKLMTVPVETPEGVEMEQNRHFRNSASRALHRSVQMPNWQSGPVPPSAGHAYGGPMPQVANGPAPVRAGQASGYSPGPMQITPQVSSVHGFRGGMAGGTGYGASGSGGGLPSANMGKFVHSPGDGQYAPAGPTASGYLAPPPPSVALSTGTASPYKATEGDSAAISGTLLLRRSESRPAASPSFKRSASFPGRSGFSLNKSIQILDDRPVVKDYRSPTPATTEASKSEKKKAPPGASFAAKLDRRLQSLLSRIAAAENTRALVNGKILIRLELKDKPDAGLLTRLKQLGLALTGSNGRFVTGRIEPGSVKNLAELAEVLQIKLA